MNVFKLFCGLRLWTIPLDESFLKEVPGVDGFWGESVHPSFSRFGLDQHDRGILILVFEEGVFPQFSHELTLDLEVDIAPISGLTTPGAWFSQVNAKYCSMVRVLMSTPAIASCRF
ncbi:hypothetical protein Tco_0400916 [Tanacetum coccineum]